MNIFGPQMVTKATDTITNWLIGMKTLTTVAKSEHSCESMPYIHAGVLTAAKLP